MLFEATLQQGLEGIVSKRLTSRYVFGERSQALAEVRAPAPPLLRRGRLAPAGGHRPTGWPRCSSGSSPPTGCSTAAGSAAASAARPSRALTPSCVEPHRPDGQPVRRRGPGASTPAARSGSSRCWSSTSRPTGVGYTRLRQPSYRGVRTDLTPEDLLGEDLLIAELVLAAAVLLTSPAADARRPSPAGPSRSTASRSSSRGHPAGRHRQPHRRLPRPGDVLEADRRRLAGPVQRRRRPDRVRRPGARHQAAAGHRHHAARHLRAARGRSARTPRRRPVEAALPPGRARRLLGAGQRVGVLQPLPQPGRGRLPLVAADERPGHAPSG